MHEGKARVSRKAVACRDFRGVYLSLSYSAPIFLLSESLSRESLRTNAFRLSLVFLTVALEGILRTCTDICMGMYIHISY